MKRSVLAGALLMSAALLFAPADTAQAKQIPADGNIPLTSEYFPDEWFLKYRAKPYDKDENGYLSPEEIAEVTTISCIVDLPDFTSIQYFTNLRELELHRNDEVTFRDGVWVGTDIDLTVFPNLESVYIFLDTGKAPAGSPKVQIKASGLTHLKSIQVVDEISGTECNFDGSNAKIDVIDLRGTPALETVKISDAEGVIFDDNNQIRDIQIINMPEIPSKQIGTFRELERLYIWANLPDYASQDFVQESSLTELNLKNEYLQEARLTGANSLEFVDIESKALKDIDISGNQAIEKLNLKSLKLKNLDFSEHKKLKGLFLECPALDSLTIAGADALERVRIDESALKAVDISKNQSLKQFSLTSPILYKMDVSKNPGLEYLAVDSDQLKSIDVTKNKELKNLYVSSSEMKAVYLKKNRKLESLGVNCENMHALDLSANTNLTWLRIDATPLKKLDLKKQKKLKEFQIKNNQKPPKLDLSANVNLKDVVIENTGYREISLPKQKKLRRLCLTGNKKLAKVDLKNNRSLDWLIINGNKKLKKLDLSNNIKLDEIDVRDNSLKTLKLGKQKYVRFLYCQGNKLKVLDLTNVKGGLYEVWCDKGVKVKGYKGKVTFI